MESQKSPQKHFMVCHQQFEADEDDCAKAGF